jgi:DNA-binding response OmpR family regulator
MRVLLVEDSLLLQQTVGTALRRSGYAVDVSGDGEDGLWRAENTDCDAIVLDETGINCRVQWALGFMKNSGFEALP